ncbi:MAG: DUF4062 domain-containing protein [Desulfuromonadaceae bacterium]|nr:DUF4062 domain-containing protein [Desulfuromonadaceae bacterium]
MRSTWKTVRVFISSTFRDMQAERDYLVKRVFPALRQKLDPHRIHLVDIDLRWGITKEQSDNDLVLGFCLQQIDECRPFFLGLLGGRYGWVPTKFPVEVGKRYGWTQDLTGKSVTELEIIHGVLNDPAMHGRAIFCLRSDRFIEAIDDEQQNRIYVEGPTDEEIIEFGPEEAKRRAEKRSMQLMKLKEQIQNLLPSMPLLKDYPCEWNPTIPDPVSKTSGRLDGLKIFGDWIIEKLEQAILNTTELQEHLTVVRTETRDELAEERDFHEQFIERRTRVYVRRKSLRNQLADYVKADITQTCLVTGSSGSGKSALLARFVGIWKRARNNEIVITHCIGASPRSTSLREMLRHLCMELKDALKLGDEIKQDVRELSDQFRDIIEKVPTECRVVLVLDALNQLDETDNAHLLYWLPTRIPPQVRLVVSCIDDTDRTYKEQPALAAMLSRKPHVIEVGDLDPKERLHVIREVPSVAAKTLDETQIETLLRNPATKNPLFLLVALEELRGFGSFDELDRKIAVLPHTGDTLTAIFQQVIQRLREDFNSDTVKGVLTLLSCARRGLSERELLDLFEGEKVSIEDSTSDLFPILRQLRPYLQFRGTQLDFYHQHLAKAVNGEYFNNIKSGKLETHKHLATYFYNKADPLKDNSFAGEVHALSELPFQISSSEQHLVVSELLQDMRYLDARCSADTVVSLIDDFSLLGNHMDESTESFKVFLQLHHEKLMKFPSALFSLAHHEGRQVVRSAAQKLVAQGRWKKPWLRTERVPISTPQLESDRVATIEVLRKLEFNRSSAVTFATEAGIVFRVKNLGEIVFVHLHSIEPVPQVLIVRRNNRPLALFASADARYLVIAYDIGEADVILISLNDHSLLVAQSIIRTVSYHIPELDAPVMVWRGSELFFQPDETAFSRLSCGSVPPMHHRLPLPPSVVGELSGIVFLEELLIAGLRFGSSGGIIIFDSTDARMVIRHDRVHPIQLCTCSDSVVAVSWSDRRLSCYDVNRQFSLLSEMHIEENVLQFAWYNDSFVWSSSSGGLHIWCPDDGAPIKTRFVGDESVYPSNLRITTWQLVPLNDGLLATVTDVGVTCFRPVYAKSVSVPPQLYAVIQLSDRALVLQKRDNGAWLVDIDHGVQTFVADNRGIPLYPVCDTDGHYFLLASHSDGSIKIDLKHFRNEACANVPMGITSVAGDKNGGFWLADRMGRIHRLEPNGKCRIETTLDLRGASGANLLCTGKYLIWFGQCYWHHENGEDTAHALVVYQRGIFGLKLVGQRIFKKSEGHIQALDFDEVTRQLVLVVQNSKKYPIAFLVGTFDQLLHETECQLPWKAPVDKIHRISISSGGEMLQILCGDGICVVLDLKLMKVIVAITPTIPFTDLARRSALGSLAMIISGRNQLYSCFLEGNNEQ